MTSEDEDRREYEALKTKNDLERAAYDELQASMQDGKHDTEENRIRLHEMKERISVRLPKLMMLRSGWDKDMFKRKAADEEEQLAEVIAVKPDGYDMLEMVTMIRELASLIHQVAPTGPQQELMGARVANINRRCGMVLDRSGLPQEALR